MFRQDYDQRLWLVKQRHGELIHEAEQYRLARAHPYEVRPIRNETPMRSRVARLALVMLAGALLTASLGVGLASANSGQDHRDADVTFTKWITTFPAMAGVDGGVVGPGAYSGEILKYTPGSVTTVIDAIYHINGSRHSFTALVEVKQTGLKAVILGVVTDGWEKGDLVNGEYTQVRCDHDGITTDCFRGTLDLSPGSDH